MRHSWFYLADLDGGSPFIFPTDLVASQGFGRGDLFSQLGSLFEKSLNQSSCVYIPGTLALQGASNCISNFAGALLFWFASHSNSNFQHKSPGKSYDSKGRNVKCITCCKNKLVGFFFGSKSRTESSGSGPGHFSKIVNFAIANILRDVEQCHTFPVLSLAAASVPPFDNLTPNVLAVPQENTDFQVNGLIDQSPFISEHQESFGLSFPEMNFRKHAVEPITGIKFPTVLDSLLIQSTKSTYNSEVLVGTGSRTMRIVKIKSLRVYAFGLYVHPGSVCEKLGPKYSSVPVGELNDCPSFFEDLLREDISMTVRLVVNCNGLKINTVRDAFEKSLRARLLKTNPDTDYHCLRAFGSHFAQDIPLPLGTMIDFRRTADGQLITAIDGKQIGAVHSKDLCRAFFDMYIGDVPVSVQAKEQIARRVGSIIKRC